MQFILWVLEYHQNDCHPKASCGPPNPRNYREFEISEKVWKGHTLFYVSFFNNLLTIWFLALLCELISAWHQRVVALNCYCSCVLYQILLRCPFRCRLFFFERLKRYSAVEKSKRVHSMIKAFVSTSSLLACNLLLLLLATITQHKVIVRKVARALKSFTMVTLTPAAVVASSWLEEKHEQSIEKSSPSVVLLCCYCCCIFTYFNTSTLFQSIIKVSLDFLFCDIFKDLLLISFLFCFRFVNVQSMLEIILELWKS